MSKRSGVAVLLLLLAVSLVGAAESDWVGKTRDEVTEAWGAPSKIKQQKDGSVLIYEREVLVRFAYRGEGDYSKSYSIEKDDEGKRRLKENAASDAPEPVYKKVKFKFHLDRNGEVTRFEEPKPKNVDLTGMPSPEKPSESATPSDKPPDDDE